MKDTTNTTSLDSLPEEVCDHILGYLSYQLDLRAVSHAWRHVVDEHMLQGRGVDRLLRMLHATHIDLPRVGPALWTNWLLRHHHGWQRICLPSYVCSGCGAHTVELGGCKACPRARAERLARAERRRHRVFWMGAVFLLCGVAAWWTGALQ